MAPGDHRRTILRSVEWVMRRVALPALALVLLVPGVARADDTPLGLTCTAQDGVRFCEGGTAKAVRTFDDVPLDVNVALPATGDSNLPLIVQLHGWGGKKSGLAEMKPWAAKGYAVVNYSARGFGESCGSPASRLANAAGCASGWIHLADTRYEVRDTQTSPACWPTRAPSTPRRSASPGAPTAAASRWRSPPCAIARWASTASCPVEEPGRQVHAHRRAAPMIPWTDLAYSLHAQRAHARLHDHRPPGRSHACGSQEAVLRQRAVRGGGAERVLRAHGLPQSRNADLTQWFALTNAGEPYNSNPQTVGSPTRSRTSTPRTTSTTARTRLRCSSPTAGPTTCSRPTRRCASTTGPASSIPSTPLKLMFFDFGHMRGQGKAPDAARLRTAIEAWFDHYLKGSGPAPAQDVTALTQTCPKTAPSAGPFTAPDVGLAPPRRGAACLHRRPDDLVVGLRLAGQPGR